MKLVILGDERLTKMSEPVTEFDDALKNTIAEMFKVMVKANGIGLAAPQVGINKRFFVVKTDDGIERVFINPEIVQTSEKVCTMEEGCLSVPKFYAEVVRAEKIVVQFLDLAGKPHTIEADGLLARVIQHENDHLNGVLFIDRIAPELKEKAKVSISKRFKSKAKL
ncbi:MAG: peptide deformylase [Treponemataceae bacterium]